MRAHTLGGFVALLIGLPLSAQDAPVLTLSVVGSRNQATSTWSQPRGTTGFQLVRRELTVDVNGRVSATSDWAAVYSGTAGTWTEVLPKPATVYEYRVDAALRGGGSVSSAAVRYTAPPFTTPPTLSITGSGDRATVVWGAATGVTGYEVWRQVVRQDGMVTDRMQRASVGATVTTWADVVALDGRLYQYQVVATDAASGRWPTPWVGYGAPALVAPVVSIVGAADKAVLTWTANPGATGYYVARAELGPTGKILAPPTRLTASPVTTAPWTDQVPAPLTGYEYVVTAVFAGGTQLNSEPVSYRSPAFLTPGNIMIAGGGGRVGINWCTVSGAAGYHVWRRQVAMDGRVTQPVQRNTALLSVNSFFDALAATDGMVEYQVVTVARDGRLWPSDWVRPAAP